MGTIYQLPFGTNGSYTGGLAYYRFYYQINSYQWVADNNAVKLKPSADVVIAVWKNGNDFGRIYRWKKSEFNSGEKPIWQYRICYDVLPPFDPDSQNDGSNPSMSHENYVYGYSDIPAAPGTFISSNLDMYGSREEARIALGFYDAYPITYRLTNCTAPTAPAEAAIGATVTVSFQFTTGYGIVNPSSDVYVTNNGVVIPSSYANGMLTFTMPDPSQSG